MRGTAAGFANRMEEVMTAYLIAHRRDITGPESLKAYRDGIDESIARFGGKVIARADEFEVLEGNWHSGRSRDDSRPERITLLQFPDMEKLKAWYRSSDYAQLKEIRKRSSSSDVVAVEVP